MVLGRDQDTTPAIGPGTHGRLGALTRLEVLLIHPMEELDARTDVETGNIRWTMTWSGTRLMKTVGLTVIA